MGKPARFCYYSSHAQVRILRHSNSRGDALLLILWRGACFRLRAVMAGTAMIVFIGLRVSGLNMINKILPPAVLSAKAQEIIESLGYPAQAVDHAARSTKWDAPGKSRGKAQSMAG